MSPRVLGCDPSLSGTGLCWADDAYCTCGGSGDHRLWVLYRAVRDAACAADALVDERCDLAVVEAPFESGTGSARSGMAHGVVRLALMTAGVRYLLVPPATLKVYATGKGNATKPDMRVALLQRFGLDLRDDDQADAFWLRAIGMDLLGCPVMDLPKSHRRALDKLALPGAVSP